MPFLVAGPLAVAEIVGGGQISAYFLLFEALFVPVMHGSRRLARACTGVAIGAGAVAVLAALLGDLPGPAVFVAAMISGLMVSTPLLWGWEVRHHREARRTAERLAGLEHELAASRAARAVESERRAALREKARRGGAVAAHGGPTEVRAIIPGRVVSVSVVPGDEVVAGQQLLVVEAMKMQNELRAPRPGTVTSVAVGEGRTIEVGDVLLVLA